MKIFFWQRFCQHDRDFGDKTADLIDNEINQIIKACFVRAKKFCLLKK
jgi:ATP-dependent Zn protease